MDNCPKCKSNWLGESIPQNIAHHYYGTHFKREIGIDGGYIGVYDGIVALKCPDCSEEFPRDNSKWALNLFDKYKKVIKK